MASFPNSIRQFTTKRDGVDVNYAAHINDLQDELGGVENALGILPAFDSRIGPKGTAFSTVKDRLNALSSGKNMSAFVAGPSAPFILPSDNYWHAPTLAAPSASQDPDGLWNGTGFTINNTGIWVIIYYAQFDANSAPGTKSVTTNRNRLASSFGAITNNSTPNEPFTANHIECEYLTAGTTFSLYAKNQTTAAQTIRYYSIGGFQVRGL